MKMASRLIDLISKKTNCTCSTLFLLISKKQICTCSTLFVFPLPLFCTTTTLFCTTKTSNFLVTHYFYGEIVVCVYPIFCFQCSCSLLFFTAAHFHLAGRKHFSFSHRRFEFPRFSSNEFSIARSSSFSVIHVSVHIKNNAEKDTTFFFVKVRAAMWFPSK